MRKTLASLFLALSLCSVSLPVRAGIPVIDVGAIAQLIEQITYWQQQIQAMKDQIDQLRQTYDSMTGQRGYEGLLPTTEGERNYLPSDKDELLRVLDGSSAAYAEIVAQIKTLQTVRSVLSARQLAGLSASDRQLVEEGRRAAAALSSLASSAYHSTGQRVNALQQLIAAIAGTGDSKAVAELQARINAEQAMLSNEQTKLQAMYQVALAEEAGRKQRLREQVIFSHGGFSNRFTPRP